MKTKKTKILKLAVLASFILAPAAWAQSLITSGLALHYTPSSQVPSTIPPYLSNWNNTGTAPSGGNLFNSLSNPIILSNELNDFNVSRWSNNRMRSGTVAAMNGDDVTGLTYMMVIRQTAIPTGYNVFASMQYSGLAGLRTSPLRIGHRDDGNYALDGANSTGGHFAGPSAAATLNEWQVLAATWDKAGNMSLYLDGVHAGTVAGGNLSIDGKNATFLELNVTSGGIGLDLAEVMVYSRALSAAEITQNTAYLNDVYAIPEPRFQVTEEKMNPTEHTRSDRQLAEKSWKYNLHEKVSEVPLDHVGPFARLKSGELVAISSRDCMISSDEGKTWQAYAIFSNPADFEIRWEHTLIVTRNGTLIVVFTNGTEIPPFRWNYEISDAPGYQTPTYSVRSMDGGRTWEAPVLLHKEWTGANRDIIQTESGAIVLSTQVAVSNPGRHTALTYVSEDEGRSWVRSNKIDMGGVGHHSGVFEATITQLKDGRLWMLMRSNWNKFWEAYSNDDGRSWGWIQSSNIPASSSPGMLKRLQSGRLVLVWSRAKATDWQADNAFSDVTGMSLHRDHFSIMFSDDDGLSWTQPVDIVQTEQLPVQVSYPQIFEVHPGELWISSTWPHCKLVMRVLEKDFTGNEVRRIRFDRTKRTSPLPGEQRTASCGS